MAATLRELRPVHVVGIGLHPYQRPGDTPYTALGVKAVGDALADAGIEWRDVETAYTGTATTAMGLSRLMYRHFGSTGIPMAQVENASASGSTAVRQACIDVAAGLADVAIAVGVDKPLKFGMPQPAAGLRDLVGGRVAPFTHFALLANRYIHEHGATEEQFALVAVKNSENGALNPNAQRQKARSLEEVLAPPLISGPLTRLQCCPVGEGAAAVDRRLRRGDRAPRARSGSRGPSPVVGLPIRDRVPGRELRRRSDTRETVGIALHDAGVTADDLDVVELHDAFTVEELLYIEAIGLAPVGKAAAHLAEGQFHVGGRVAVSASGGLLSMGHPIGPTGVGQICELTTQLRGEGGARQHAGARTGLADMVGVGAVCVVHVLQAP